MRQKDIYDTEKAINRTPEEIANDQKEIKKLKEQIKQKEGGIRNKNSIFGDNEKVNFEKIKEETEESLN